MENPPVLSETRWFWPVVFLPYAIDRALTWTFTRRAGLGGMKSSLSRATLELSPDGIVVRSRLTGVAHLRVAAEDLLSCEVIGGSAEVVEVRFGDADRSRFARMLLSGSPSGAFDRVILNVRTPTEWKAKIDRLVAAT
ncbi:MAG TPA: hypothetical protein VIW46_06560 [Acidimicrobiia bacterium]|jgi:hypothetical protein